MEKAQVLLEEEELKEYISNYMKRFEAITGHMARTTSEAEVEPDLFTLQTKYAASLLQAVVLSQNLLENERKNGKVVLEDIDLMTLSTLVGSIIGDEKELLDKNMSVLEH